MWVPPIRHSRAISAVAVDQFDNEVDSPIVASSYDGVVSVWYPGTCGDGVVRQQFHHMQGVSDVCFAREGKNIFDLFVTASGRTVVIWDKDGIPVRQILKAHTKNVTAICLSLNRRFIVSGSADGTFCVWSRDGNLLQKCETSLTVILSVAIIYTLYGLRVIVGGNDGIFEIWSSVSNIRISLEKGARVQEAPSPITTISVSPDFVFVAIGNRAGHISIWDCSKHDNYENTSPHAIINKLRKFLTTDCQLNCIAFCDNRYWISAATTVGIFIWEFDTMEEIKVISYPNEYEAISCTSIMWRNGPKNTPILVSGWADGAVRVFEIND